MDYSSAVSPMINKLLEMALVLPSSFFFLLSQFCFLFFVFFYFFCFFFWFHYYYFCSLSTKLFARVQRYEGIPTIWRAAGFIGRCINLFDMHNLLVCQLSLSLLLLMLFVVFPFFLGHLPPTLTSSIWWTTKQNKKRLSNFRAVSGQFLYNAQSYLGSISEHFYRISGAISV